MTKQEIINSLYQDYNNSPYPKLSKKKFIRELQLDGPKFNEAYEQYRLSDYDPRLKPVMIFPKAQPKKTINIMNNIKKQ